MRDELTRQCTATTLRREIQCQPKPAKIRK